MKKTEDEKIWGFLKYNEQSNVGQNLYCMADMKFELIWLYNYLEIKGAESEQRGKPMSDEYKKMIHSVKRASLFITHYCARLEQQDAQIEELKRQNEALKSQLPKFNIKEYRLHWNGSKLIYVKKRADDAVSVFLLPKPIDDRPIA